MLSNEAENYARIAKAIEYIRLNFKSQPSLDEVAEKINLSPFHFQRVFTEWAGVSPKKFLQFLSVEHAKSILSNKQATLFETADSAGLSGTGRLHDLFVQMEGMTPGEYKNGGKELQINYNFEETNFGTILIASTAKGICYIGFADDKEKTKSEFLHQFPNAILNVKTDDLQQNALQIFSKDWLDLKQIKLHLKGTDFQLKVWQALLRIPMGKLETYGKIAGIVNNPKASRAVGSAVGDSPIAFIIPCHRVIQSSGVLGQYHWGGVRKAAMVGWEAANQ